MKLHMNYLIESLLSGKFLVVEMCSRSPDEGKSRYIYGMLAEWPKNALSGNRDKGGRVYEIVVLPKIALGVACGLFLCCKAMPVMADQPEHTKYRGPAFRLDHRQQSAQWLAKCL